MDIVRTGAADAELVRMIERRSRQGEVDPEYLRHYALAYTRRAS